MKRREFVKSTFAMGAVLGFPAIVSARSPNSKVCHACIGTANMAGADLGLFAKCDDIADITAICDVDANFLAAAKKKLPNARVYRDWRELLEKEGDKLDSVNVSTPDHTHTIIAANAIRQGKHVYCQKPLCKKFDECRFLRKVARDSNVITQLGTQFASTLGDRQIIELLKQGVIGPVKRVNLFSTRDGKSRAKRDLTPVAPAPEYLDWENWLGPAAFTEYRPKIYHPLLWRMWKQFGSGWVGDICIHVISAPWFGLGMGHNNPIAVEAKVEADSQSNETYKKGWPRWSNIKWEMPGVAASGGKPFRFEWFSGMKSDPKVTPEFLPPAEFDELFAKTPLKTRSAEGRVIEGEDGWILAPHTSSPVVLMKNGTVIKAPKLEKTSNHHRQFLEQVSKGTKNTRSPFETTTWMMETVLLGAVCEQLPNRRLEWNAATAQFKNAPDANALLKSAYRDGWKLEGLS